MQALSLEDLGMERAELILFREALRRPFGEVLITGPTGAGKSTTLYAGLEELNRPEVKIYTVEDPVERVMPGILQSQIRPLIGMTFASMLRSLVRGDPDIIMIGEIRDKETAFIAAEASLTGHLVLSTLHTNDAASAVTRLVEMGLPPYLISSSLVCVVAQRLARKLCPRCRQTVFRGTRLDDRGRACSPGFDGGRRRKGGRLRQLLQYRLPGKGGAVRDPTRGPGTPGAHTHPCGAERVREHTQRLGMKTLREDGRLKVLAGLTTAEEVERLTT